MELENIFLSEVTQTQEDMHGMYSRVDVSHKVQNNHATFHRQGRMVESVSENKISEMD